MSTSTSNAGRGLRLGMQMLLQRRTRAGGMSCAGFTNVPVLTPGLVTIVGPPGGEADGDTADLERAFRAIIAGTATEIAPDDMPCSGSTRGHACHAHAVPACKKLLVVVGQKGVAFPDEDLITWWLGKGPGYFVLPLLPRGADAPTDLPPALVGINASWWDAAASERIDEVLSFVGLAPSERRVFISYRRDDTQEIAEQLYDELGKHRFDVFLDRFSVDPGVDFQERLTDELAHKSMVVILESPTMHESEWIRHELAFAATRQLGRLAVNLPGGRKVPGLTDDLRITIGLAQLVPRKGAANAVVAKTDRLDAPAVAAIVERLIDEHSRALVRRRRFLYESLSKALDNRGVASQELDVRGHLRVTPNRGVNAGKPYVIWMTPRPPEVGEYRAAHGICHPGPDPRGAILTIALYRQSQRRTDAEWLAARSLVTLTDEGHMGQLADRIANGRDL